MAHASREAIELPHRYNVKAALMPTTFKLLRPVPNLVSSIVAQAARNNEAIRDAPARATSSRPPRHGRVN
jgi:hypothetical protein